MKMQDLLMPGHAHNSKKDDSVLPDDDEPTLEPLAGAEPSPNSPTDAIEPMNNPKQETVSAAAVNGFRDDLKLTSTGQTLLRIPAVGLMFADTLYGAPTLLPELVNRWGAVHKILVILTVRQVAPSDSTSDVISQPCTLWCWSGASWVCAAVTGA